MRAVLGVLMVVGACVRSSAVPCGDRVCPEGLACAQYTPSGATFCVDGSATECAGAPDGTLCDGQHGTCYGGACFPVGCGNGHIDDAVYGRGEQCDDGNRKTHDGCSSACTIEEATWDKLAPGAPPRASEHAIAYDVNHGTDVMFGGQTYTGAVIDQTWVRGEDGSWEMRIPAGFYPDARHGHAMAYDAKHHQVVMFGGNNGMEVRDTWLWDGQRWTPVTPKHAPSARAGQAMAYDPIHQVAVMYGGQSGSSIYAETWLWDGADWTLVMPASGGQPPGFTEHAMAFDPVRGQIVMVGESDAGVVTTWTWDGAAWTNATPAGGGPPAVNRASLAFDPATGRLVLAGAGTWTWDGAGWTDAGAAPLAPGAVGTASATMRGGLLAHGGYATGQTTLVEVATVWRWLSGGWSAVAASAAPGRRINQAIGFDADRGTVVMAGGQAVDPVGPLAETWELTQFGWSLRASGGTQPLTTSTTRIAYDTAHHEMVLFGATDASTWLWDGHAWTDTHVPGPARSGQAVVYDPASGVIALGGQTGMSIGDQMTVWNGAAWTTPATTPPPGRINAAMAYDPIAKKVLLFGGLQRGPINDTWEWDGATQTWTELFPLGSPTPRAGHSLVWNAARQRLVLFGGGPDDAWEWDREIQSWVPIDIANPGEDHAGVAVPAPDGTGVVVLDVAGSALVLARLRWSGAGSLESCSAADADGDGLAGCDDPDCALVCAAVAATCGDGTCGAGETCGLCPADCGACAAQCGDFACAPDETPESCPGDCAPPP